MPPKPGRCQGAAGGAAAPAAAAGSEAAEKAARELRKALATYAKGQKQDKCREEIEKAHAQAPSALTCQALTKVRVAQAVAAAMKVGCLMDPKAMASLCSDGGALQSRHAAAQATGGRARCSVSALRALPCCRRCYRRDPQEKREEPALRLLHDALALALEGAFQHHSINCLALCTLVIHMVSGRPGGRPAASQGCLPMLRRRALRRHPAKASVARMRAILQGGRSGRSSWMHSQGAVT